MATMTRSTDLRRASEESTVAIMIVDDHAIVRQGLRSILEREPDLRVVAEASKPDEALVVIGRVRPDIVLLDLKLSTSSDTEGLELCEALTSAYSEVAVLVLTTFLDEHLVLQAIRAGAKGYVVKDVDTSGLVRAIRDVSRGRECLRLPQRGGDGPGSERHPRGGPPQAHPARVRGAQAARPRLVQP